MRAFNKELRGSGILVATEGLDLLDQTKIVYAGADGGSLTDGVFRESEEFLAGFSIIDVDTREQPYKIAARASMAPGPKDRGSMPLEVRPVMSGPPPEFL